MFKTIFAILLIGTLAQAYLTPQYLSANSLQGTPVSATPPTLNQILQYNGSAWAPTTVSLPPLLTTGSVLFGDSGGGIGQNNSTFFWDNTNGRLGIGTTTPAARLEVVSTLSTIPRGIVSTQVISGTQGGGMYARHARGTPGSLSAVLSGDTLGHYYGVGYGTTGWSNTVNGGLQIVANQNFTDTAQGTYLAFLTTPNNSATPAEVVRITDAGNVGIGTTTPTAKLDVHSTTNPIIQSNLLGSQGTSGGGTVQVLSDPLAAILSGSRLGAFQFTGAYDGSSNFANGALINAFATENWSPSAQGTKMEFRVTANGANSRSTAMIIDQDSSVNINSTSANALTVGPNGTTNPVLQVDTSTASQDSGVKITGAASGTSSVVSATGSVTNVPLALSSKGASGVSLQIGGTTRYLMTSFNHTFSMGLSSAASNPRFGLTGGADNSLTASTEAPSVYFNIGQTRSHSTGNYALQRDFRITPSTHAFAGASTITTAAGLAIDGAPIAGSNATFTNSSSIYTGGVNVGSGVTSSYGAYINANSGATNNYSAVFMNGNVGIGTSNPTTALTVNGNITNTGTAPTISSCGGGSIGAGSTNHKGQITGVSSATACTITFSSALGTAPACLIIGSAVVSSPVVTSISTSAVTFGFSSYSGTLYYHCL